MAISTRRPTSSFTPNSSITRRPRAGRDGPAGMIETASWLRETFGNPTLEVQDIVAEGDRVVIRVLCRGTHVGELMGIPPTGKSFEVQQFHEYRIQDGQIAEHWACRDDIGMMRQLGVIPDRQMAG